LGYFTTVHSIFVTESWFLFYFYNFSRFECCGYVFQVIISLL
jgi:hypothetical protein